MGGFLYQTPTFQLMLILYSFAVGICIGIVYSIFNTISIMLGLHIVNSKEKNQVPLQNVKKKTIISKIFQFSIDFLFSMVYTVIVVVFIFCANHGKFRFFMLVFAVMGFVLYKLTVGRFISFCMQAVFLFVYRTVKRYAVTPILYVYLFIKLRFVSAVIKRRIVNTVVGDKEF